MLVRTTYVLARRRGYMVVHIGVPPGEIVDITWDTETADVTFLVEDDGQDG